MLKTALTFLLLASPGLFASTFSYNVAVNTSSLASTTGTLYFQFNPGDVSSDAATATLSNFLVAAPGSLTGAPSLSPGATSGGGVITIPNTGPNNDALQAIAFGSALSFRLTIAETFTGKASTGSVFNFGVFQNDGFTPSLTTQADGYSIIVNLDNANRATAQSTTAAVTILSPVPEPGTMILFGTALAGLLWKRRSRQAP